MTLYISPHLQLDPHPFLFRSPAVPHFCFCICLILLPLPPAVALTVGKDPLRELILVLLHTPQDHRLLGLPLDSSASAYTPFENLLSFLDSDRPLCLYAAF